MTNTRRAKRATAFENCGRCPRFAGSPSISYPDPGACAPGFMLSPALRARCVVEVNEMSAELNCYLLRRLRRNSVALAVDVGEEFGDGAEEIGGD